MARPGPQKRQITDADELIRVWVTHVRSGPMEASRAHGVDRQTVYRIIKKVQADEALLARAKVLLEQIRAKNDDLETLVTTAKMNAKIALYRRLEALAPEMTPAQVTAAIGVIDAPTEGDGKSGGNVVIQIPPTLAAPRSDGSA